MYCVLCGGRQGFKRFELFFGGLESPAFGRVTFVLYYSLSRDNILT